MANELQLHFITFCNFGVSGGGKTTMTDKNLKKLFKDSNLYGKSLTVTDTDIAFSKVKSHGKKDITFDQFDRLLHEVAPKYGKDNKLGSAEDAYHNMVYAISSSGPSLAGTTGVSKTGDVERMTDHTHYTGSHKERFDEHGKGKGLEGRTSSASSTGYVGAYKGSGTYDKTHK